MKPDRRPIRQRLADYYTEADHDAGDAGNVHRIIDRLDEGAYL